MRVRISAILGASKKANHWGGPKTSGTETIVTSHSASMGAPSQRRGLSAVDGDARLRRLNGLFLRRRKGDDVRATT